MAVNNERKSWRRLTIGAFWYVSFMGGFFYLVAKGESIELIQIFILALTLGCLFYGGFITATDLLDRWKK